MAREIHVDPIPNATAAFLPKSVRSELLADAAVEARNIAIGAIGRLALSVELLSEIDANTAGLAGLREQLTTLSGLLEETAEGVTDTDTLLADLAALRADVVELQRGQFDDERIDELIRSYLRRNPIEGVTQAQLNAAVAGLQAQIDAIDTGGGGDGSGDGEADGVTSSATLAISATNVLTLALGIDGAPDVASNGVTLPSTAAPSAAQIEQAVEDYLEANPISVSGLTQAAGDARYVRSPLTAAGIPDLPASKITSGTIHRNRIGTGSISAAVANSIVSATRVASRLPGTGTTPATKLWSWLKARIPEQA